MERAGQCLTAIGTLLLLGAGGAWLSFYFQLRDALAIPISVALPCLLATSDDCLMGLQLTGATTSPLAFWAGAFLFWAGGCLWAIAFVERDRRTFNRH